MGAFHSDWKLMNQRFVTLFLIRKYMLNGQLYFCASESIFAVFRGRDGRAVAKKAKQNNIYKNMFNWYNVVNF